MKKTAIMGVALSLLMTLAWAGPKTLTYHGRACDLNGDPLPYTKYHILFSLWDHPTTGTPLWSEIDYLVPVTMGMFFTMMGDGSPFPTNLFSTHPDLWLQVGIDVNQNGVITGDEQFLPRLQVTAAAWTIEADRLQGQPASVFARVPHSHPGTHILSAVSEALTALTARSLQGWPVSPVAPANGNWLGWNGMEFAPVPPTTFPNKPPVAVLEANPSVTYIVDDKPATTTLSSALSYDPEQPWVAMVRSYDPTGRTIGPPTFHTGVVTTTAQYTEPGQYLAAVWVRDNHDAVSRAQTLVTVKRWRQTQPDPSPSVGRYNSLTVVNGRPAILYMDSANETLWYVHAKDADGSSWEEPVSPVNMEKTGRYASLAVIGGGPAIAYRGGPGSPNVGSLMYARAADPDGRGWYPAYLADDGGTWNDHVGDHCSLTEVQATPAIAYVGVRGASSYTEWTLRYVRANDQIGRIWGDPVVVDDSGVYQEVGEYASLAVVNGRPAIAYYQAYPSGFLKYCRAADASGASWGAPIIVDDNGSCGTHASMVVVNGRPAVAYMRPWAEDLMYVRALDANGALWGTPITVDGFGRKGQFSSLAIINGRPAIAYRDISDLDAKYVRANDPDGASWGTPVAAAKDGIVGHYTRLAAVDGQPAVTYYDYDQATLNYVILRDE